MSRTSLALLVGLPVICINLAIASVGAQGPNAEAAKLKNPVKATPESIASGKDMFAKRCAFCHGPEAKGNGTGTMIPKGANPPDLTDAKWTVGGSDGEIFTAIQDGVGPKDTDPTKWFMKPSKGKITDTDIWNLVNYLRSIGPKTAAGKAAPAKAAPAKKK